jgi:hypothetical protein
MKHPHRLAATALLALVSAAAQADTFEQLSAPSALHVELSIDREARHAEPWMPGGNFAADERAAPSRFSAGHEHGAGSNPFHHRPGASHEWPGHAPPVPEPSTVALWLAGLGVVGFLGVRRKLDR